MDGQFHIVGQTISTLKSAYDEHLQTAEEKLDVTNLVPDQNKLNFDQQLHDHAY